MTAPTPLANPSDVEDVWRPLTDGEQARILNLITKASAELRHTCPFDIDARITLYETTPGAVTALDPVLVASVVANIVKRFLVNQEGAASKSEAVGPFSHSATYVNRYDKTGSDVRGAIQVIDSDIERLRPAVPAVVPSSFQVDVPLPRVLIPRGGPFPGTRPDGSAGLGPVIVPDVAPGTGTE